jgi:laccase
MNIGRIGAATRFYQFKVQTIRLTRLCQTNEIVTVNKKFPGPAISAQEDDRIVIKVINMTPYNTTIHWYADVHIHIYIKYKCFLNEF